MKSKFVSIEDCAKSNWRRNYFIV